MTARATASFLFLLIARAASADDECAGGSCPVPSHFASAAPPEAPEFDVHELSDDGAWSKVATEHSVNAGADAEEEEEEGELDLGTETETMSMEDFKKMATKSAAAAEKEPSADAGKSASGAAAPAPAAAADAGESYGGSATTAAAPGTGAEEGAAKSKLAQSKLAQSKVGPSTEEPAGALAAVDEAPFDLLTEISLMRVMAQMGATTQMMEILVNATFALGDTDRDGQLSPAEGGAFAKAHLQETSPLAVVLGLSGGHLPLADEAATARAIESIRAKCDTDANGLVDRTEAVACAEWVYGLLVDANEKRLQHALKQQQAQQQAGGGAKAAGAGAGAAKAAAGGGAGGAAPAAKQQQQQQQQASSLNDWFQSMAAGGAGGAGGGAGAAARRKPSPIQAAIDRRLQMVQRVLLEHWRNPNMNTLMGGLGLAALVLRELLAIDLFELRRKLRGLVGSNVDEFNTRLMHVGLLSILVAAVAKID
jgi:hypothetical protein